MTMSASDIEKLDKTKQTEMKNLYSEAFEPLYKWGHERLKDDKEAPITVHFSKLHRAPPRYLRLPRTYCGQVKSLDEPGAHRSEVQWNR